PARAYSINWRRIVPRCKLNCPVTLFSNTLRIWFFILTIRSSAAHVSSRFCRTLKNAVAKTSECCSHGAAGRLSWSFWNWLRTAHPATAEGYGGVKTADAKRESLNPFEKSAVID